MLSYKFLFSILFVLFYIHHSSARIYEVSDTLEKQWKVKKNNVVTYDRSMGKRQGTFLYATCDPSVPNQYDCTFVLDNLFSYLANSRANMTCHLKIQGTETRQLLKNMTVERFVTDSIFVTLPVKEGEELYNEYGFINMPNCEHTKLRQVGQPTWNSGKSLSKFVLYRNTFDVIDYKNPSCDHNLCRLSHTHDGRTSNEVSFANLNPWSIQPVSYDDDQDGFFVFSDNATSPLVANLVTKSGVVKPLLSVPKSAAQYWYPRYATNRLSVCYTSETGKYFTGDVHCIQYQYWSIHGLQRSVDTSVELDDTTVLAVYNVAEGGLLVLTGRCDSPDEKLTCKNLKARLITVETFDVPDVEFGCKPVEGSMSVDIKEEGLKNFNFNFAAICDDSSSEYNTIKFKRIVINARA